MPAPRHACAPATKCHQAAPVRGVPPAPPPLCHTRCRANAVPRGTDLLHSRRHSRGHKQHFDMLSSKMPVATSQRQKWSCRKYQLHRHSASPCKTAPKIYPRVGSSKILFSYWPSYFAMVCESFTVKNLNFPTFPDADFQV